LLRCNATLTDIKKYYNDEIERDFLNFCVAFYIAENEFNIHQNDAIESEKMRQMEKANKKK
jgi:hypothetical protein